MFYCDPCADTCRWPKTAARWRGLCEMCGKFSEDMSDLPSAALPRPVALPERQPQPSSTEKP
jgi:hypothetical protein